MLKFERHIFCLRINPIATWCESKPGLQVKSIIDTRGELQFRLGREGGESNRGFRANGRCQGTLDVNTTDDEPCGQLPRSLIPFAVSTCHPTPVASRSVLRSYTDSLIP